MKKHSLALWFFGGMSLLTGATALLSSFITYHPSITKAAYLSIVVVMCIWAVTLLMTAVLCISAVPLASGGDLQAARSIRRQGMWFVIPQVALFVILAFAGLLVARD